MCISFFLFFPLTLSFELTSYTVGITIICLIYLKLRSHKNNDYMSTLFVTVSLSGVYNMTFSLTVCLVIVSLGILASVGQEHKSTAQEKLFSKT